MNPFGCVAPDSFWLARILRPPLLKKNTLWQVNQAGDPGPKGFNHTNNCGKRVREAISAINIARPVNRPKYMVGRKLESIRMEKPTMMIIEV